MAAIDAARLKAMFTTIDAAIDADKDRLCQLDGVIGDADHGIAMALGFGAVKKALTTGSDAAEPNGVLNTAAKSFLNAVGASCGPLYATAFMRAAAAVKGKAVLEEADVAAMFAAMAKGIKDRGKAEVGDKTMVDVWVPAAEAMSETFSATGNLETALDACLEAARRGAQATMAMIARKGRSARLGERTLGHLDAGAASAVTVIEAMCGSLSR